jgi:DNA-binding protein YbaB
MVSDFEESTLMAGDGRFEGFSNINIENLLKQAQERIGKMTAMQDSIAEIVGSAESADGYVRATYTAATGLRDLEINPRAMRWASNDLSEVIRAVVQEATNDFQTRIRGEMGVAFEGQSDNPLDLMEDPEKAKAKIQEVQGLLDGALDDAMGTLDKVRKQLGI